MINSVSWGHVRPILRAEFSFSDIKDIVGRAGLPVQDLADIHQTSSGGASKGQLMDGIDGLLRDLDNEERRQTVGRIVSEVRRLKPSFVDLSHTVVAESKSEPSFARSMAASALSDKTPEVRNIGSTDAGVNSSWAESKSAAEAATMGKEPSMDEIPSNVTTAKRSKLCFVIMPFSEQGGVSESQWDDIFRTIKGAVEGAKLGFFCRRSVATRGSIVQGIVQDLDQASVVVADLTGRNPNVFYELGARHALANGTILLAQKRDDIPFDLRSEAAFEYEWTTAAGKRALRHRIRQLLQDFLNNPSKQDNPIRRYLPENPRKQLHRFYHELLGRVPDQPGVDHYLTQKRNGWTDRDLYVDIYFSQEATERRARIGLTK